MQCLMIF